MYLKRLIVLFLAGYLSMTCFSQAKQLTWEELTLRYEFSDWYTEARFGMWAHWGAQSVPEKGGGWYARHMYMQDAGSEIWGVNAYPYHVRTYGHLSEKGFKDVIHEWKAEKLDTDDLMKYFKELGAKYFIVLANHHDHFDNFDSTYHPWNSVNVGPKRDIVGEFEKSAPKYDMPFGISSHDDRFLSWWLPAFGADKSGPKKGVPYDGYMTAEDGKGKWWEGLNPADLYGLPPEKRTPEWIEQVKHNWLLRHKELVTKYDLDMIWFDGYEFPYGDYGKEVCQTFFNHHLQEHGKINAVIAGKFQNQPAIVKDIERGVANEILPIPWQAIVTFNGDWFYKNERPLLHNARTIIEMMTDVISKNGNLVLNVELLPDGTVPPEHKIILDDIGAWVNLNQEAIYASKPWTIYGDNLNSFLQLDESELSATDLEALKKQAKSSHFNERTIKSLPYGTDEVRFTTKGDRLFIFVLNPQEGSIELPSLGLNSKFNPPQIRAIRMLGSDSEIQFIQDINKVVLNIPEKRPSKYTIVYEVKWNIRNG